MNGYSVFNAMVDIVPAPARALDEVKLHTRWFWWPLLTLLAATIAVYVFYFTWVDFEWLVDETIRGAIRGGSPADQAEAIRGFMSVNNSIIFSILGIVLVTLAVYAIQAGYLHLVNKAVGDPSLGYGQWFSFTVWTAFVGIFNALAALVVILMADSNQLAQTELAPLSMNALFIHAEPGETWFTWGNSLGLVNFWMLWLMTLGFARWTGASMGKAALVAVTPWALLFGIWALLLAV